ncbi:MAG TPA: RluA family pseudouridine synthase [Sphaerochaetaceae bacterium]|nr:RluA family pseudouridine synthase [Sphaerochaetaceae bacterium]
MASKEHHDKLTVEEPIAVSRIDAWVSQMNPHFPRSAASDSRTVFRINGIPVKKSKQVKCGDTVEVSWYEDVLDSIEAQEQPLAILYEDPHILVIDKQQSLVVHPGAGNPDKTLVNALVFKYGDDFFSSDQEFETVRPGIVHRLDKDTSGVMVIAKHRESHAHLALQFSERTTEKYYLAIVDGIMPKRRGHIETTIVRDPKDRKRFIVGKADTGKYAKTDYLVLRQFTTCALVRIRLHTGRTHQIRVHMAHIGTPVIGDPIYGKRGTSIFESCTLMLHALSLELYHPVSEKRMRFRAPMPNRFKQILRNAKPVPEQKELK